MKILIVDDERALAALMDRVLRHFGHAPVVTLDPGEALTELGPDIDAVITDIEMPEMNGVEMARAMRDIDPSLPIAFCTGSDPAARLVTEAEQIGPVLSKSWTFDQLQGLVSQLQRRRRTPAVDHAELRRTPRYRVHLPIQYRSDDGEHQGVAENLSAGGMFIRDADHLEPGESITIEAELPGFVGALRAQGEVTYTLSRSPGSDVSHAAGAGVRLFETDPGFAEALERFLQRLERRGNYVVYASDRRARILLEEAGYQARPAPPPAQLADELSDSDELILGVIVPPSQKEAYAGAALAAGLGDLVRAVDDATEDIDRSLLELDMHS